MPLTSIVAFAKLLSIPNPVLLFSVTTTCCSGPEGFVIFILPLSTDMPVVVVLPVVESVPIKLIVLLLTNNELNGFSAEPKLD